MTGQLVVISTRQSQVMGPCHETTKRFWTWKKEGTVVGNWACWVLTRVGGNRKKQRVAAPQVAVTVDSAVLNYIKQRECPH